MAERNRLYGWVCRSQQNYVAYTRSVLDKTQWRSRLALLACCRRDWRCDKVVVKRTEGKIVPWSYTVRCQLLLGQHAYPHPHHDRALLVNFRASILTDKAKTIKQSVDRINAFSAKVRNGSMWSGFHCDAGEPVLLSCHIRAAFAMSCAGCSK